MTLYFIFSAIFAAIGLFVLYFGKKTRAEISKINETSNFHAVFSTVAVILIIFFWPLILIYAVAKKLKELKK